jgi:RNA polymerase sigma-70 factor, ECF subfamily
MPDWNNIVAREGPAVWKTLCRLLGNRSDVEECFQETFVAALGVSRRETVVSWPAMLCRLATARAMDHLRRRYRPGGQRHAVEISANSGNDDSAGDRLGEIASPAAGPVEAALATELSERLRHALARLPEKQAEIFAMRVFDGWSRRQIAERLTTTENAVGVALHRARQRLRELLSDFREPASAASRSLPKGGSR